MKTGDIEVLKMQGFKLAEKEGRKYIFAYVDETRVNYHEKSDRYFFPLAMVEHQTKYSDYFLTEKKNKEEMELDKDKANEDKLKMPIIGNFKNWKPKDETSEVSQQGANTEPTPSKDDLPF